MIDIALNWNLEAGGADLCVRGRDLLTDDGLETAVLLSLFTDRRVTPEELPAGDTGLRGWWGDALAAGDDRIGSKLWLLERAKQTPQTLTQAEAWATEALAWMIEDGLAASARCAASWREPGRMLLRVDIERPDLSRTEFQFIAPFGQP